MVAGPDSGLAGQLGAHAAVTGYQLLTRDARRYRAYFPTVSIIVPPQAEDLAA